MQLVSKKEMEQGRLKDLPKVTRPSRDLEGISSILFFAVNLPNINKHKYLSGGGNIESRSSPGDKKQARIHYYSNFIIASRERWVRKQKVWLWLPAQLCCPPLQRPLLAVNGAHWRKFMTRTLLLLQRKVSPLLWEELISLGLEEASVFTKAKWGLYLDKGLVKLGDSCSYLGIAAHFPKRVQVNNGSCYPFMAEDGIQTQLRLACCLKLP